MNNTISIDEYRQRKIAIKKPKVYESSVVDAAIKWLYLHGCFVWRNNTGSYKPEGGNSYVRYGLVGSADIIGVTPKGKFLAAECKGSVGKLSDKQTAFGEKVKQHGGIYIVAFSIDDLEKRRREIVGDSWE